jgi:hypothetical protein
MRARGLGSQQQPENEADQRQNQDEYDPQHLGPHARGAGHGADNGPDVEDEQNDAEQTAYFDAHGVPFLWLCIERTKRDVIMRGSAASTAGAEQDEHQPDGHGYTTTHEIASGRIGVLARDCLAYIFRDRFGGGEPHPEHDGAADEQGNAENARPVHGPSPFVMGGQCRTMMSGYCLTE